VRIQAIHDFSQGLEALSEGLGAVAAIQRVPRNRPDRRSSAATRIRPPIACTTPAGDRDLAEEDDCPPGDAETGLNVSADCPFLSLLHNSGIHWL
jgi:hypothetical protein